MFNMKLLQIMQYSLINQGHKCAKIMELENGKLELSCCWKIQCDSIQVLTKDDKYADMDKRNEELMKFAELLQKNGHKCVTFMESFPVQIGWCKQDVCTGKK